MVRWIHVKGTALKKGVYDYSKQASRAYSYDAGKGVDTLTIKLSDADFAKPAVQAQLQALVDYFRNLKFDAKGQAHSIFVGSYFNLKIKDFEKIKIVVGGATIFPMSDAVDDRASLFENGTDGTGGLGLPSVTGNVLDNDAVPAGTTVQLVTGPLPGHGTLILNPDGTYMFAPGADFDYLAVGETASVTITYKIIAPLGQTDTATLTFNIKGVNDNVEVFSSATPNPVTEGDTTADLSTSGDIVFTDLDIHDTHTAVAGAATVATVGYPLAEVPSGGFGSLQVSVVEDTSDSTGGGTVKWTFKVNDAAIQALGAGETVTQTYVITVSDGHGSSVTKSISVLIKGTNDAPTLETITAGTITDTNAADAFPSINGTLKHADVDLTDTAVFSITGQSGDTTVNGFDKSLGSDYGVLYLNSLTGAYRFVADAAAINALKLDVTLNFFLTVTDGSNTHATQTLTIFIDGVNDTPVISADLTAHTYLDTDADDNFDAINGTLTSTDADKNDTPTYSIDGGVADSTSVEFDQSLESDYGTLYLNSTTGAYRFIPDDAAIEGLKDTKTATFTLVVSDADGAQDTDTLVITLSGTNDTPEFGKLAEDVIDDSPGDDTFGPINGQLTSTDRDDGDTQTYSITGGIEDDSLGDDFDTSLAGTYGTLYLNSATGAYRFVPDDAAIEGLKSTDYANFTVVVTDEDGATDSETLTFTINGINDTPELTAPTAISFDDTASDDTFAAVEGTLVRSDRDDGDSYAFSIDGGGADSDLVPDFDLALDGPYGKLYLNSTSGAYRFVPDDAAIEGLKTGDTVGFDLTVTDGSGDTATQTLTITLNGVNDTPELNVPTAIGVDDTAAEDPFTAVDGTLTSSDRDTGDTPTYSIDGGAADATLAPDFDQSLDSAYGTLYLNSTTGAYRFVPDDAAIEGLKTGDTVGFDLTVTDGSGDTATQTLTINLNGVNDTPELDAPTDIVFNDHPNDDTFVAIDGALSSIDRDDGDTAAYSLENAVADTSESGFDQSVTSAYGKLYFQSATGAYRFVPDDAAIEGLKETKTATFDFTVTDAGGLTDTKTLTVTLNGTNDQPDLPPITAQTYTDHADADTFLDIVSTLGGTDRDGDDLTYSLVNLTSGEDTSEDGYDRSAATDYGTLYFNTDTGAYKFVPDSVAIEGLKTDAPDLTFTFRASDSGYLFTQQDLVIHLKGANDTPELSASPTAKTYTDTAGDDSFLVADGSLSRTDRDLNDTATYSLENAVADASVSGFNQSVTSAYGKLHFQSATGVYRFIPNDAAIEGLKGTQSATFTFKVTDGSGAADTEVLTVTLNGTNDAPELTVNPASAIYTDTASDDTFIPINGTLSSTDRDTGDTATFSLTGAGADLTVAGFTQSVTSTYGTLYFNSSNGAYRFVPNDTAIEALKAPTSTAFTFKATDGSAATDTKTLTVTLNGANDTPVITQTSGATAGTAIQVAENTATSFLTVTANDRDGDTVTFSIGANPNSSYDNTFFEIDATSGALKFKTPPDFEFNDPGGDDLYKVQVTATDSLGAATTRDYLVQVTNVEENLPPSAQAAKSVVVAETASPVDLLITAPTDPNGDGLTITVTGLPGNAVGVVRLQDGGSIYNGMTLTTAQLTTLKFWPSSFELGASGTFSYTVSDGHGGTASQAISLTTKSMTGLAGSVVISFNEISEWVALPDGYGASGTFAGFDWNTLPINIDGGTAPIYAEYGYIYNPWGVRQTIIKTVGGADIHLEEFEIARWGGTTSVTVAFLNNGTTVGVSSLSLPGGDFTDSFIRAFGPSQPIDEIRITSDATNSHWWKADDIRFWYGSEAGQTYSGTIGDDILVGGAGSDRLIGDAGHDYLVGNAGSDTFVFSSPSHGTDMITDFATAQGDKIEIKASAFGGGLVAAQSAGAVFGSTGNATFGSGTERFHFDTSTKTLWFDADGNGNGSAAVALATFSNGAVITASDLIIV